MTASIIDLSEKPRLAVDIVPPKVGIVGFDGVATLDFIGPLEAFRAARTFDNYHRTRSCYELVILGVGTRKFTSESGIVFKAEKTTDEVGSLDTLIIPGGSSLGVSSQTGAQIAEWLCRQKRLPRRIATVSTGIYPLAQSGLLDGAQVTTHWRCAHDVAQRFPKLSLNYAASFVKHGRFYTCGGAKAGIEMTLALINEDYGEQVAQQVAREFVVRLKPPGTEEAVTYLPKEQCQSTDRLADLPSWILAHLDEDLTVEMLAQQSALCPRHFSRLFRRTFKTTPADFVEQVRLGEARRRLLLPQATIKNVADSVGFKSADSFRRAFERRLGVNPSTFRLRYHQRAEKKVRLSLARHPEARGVQSR